jgi:hypothetical protein
VVFEPPSNTQVGSGVRAECGAPHLDVDNSVSLVSRDLSANDFESEVIC